MSEKCSRLPEEKRVNTAVVSREGKVLMLARVLYVTRVVLTKTF